MSEIHELIKYLKLNNIKISTLLEIGSRDGVDCDLMKKNLNLIDDNIYVVEPNNDSFNVIKNKYSFNLFECAISDVSGYFKFNKVIDSHYVGISSLKNRIDNFYNDVLTDVIDVKCITGQELMEKINRKIDLCKIDVEGHTYEVLVSFGDTINNINLIYVESEHIEIWVNQKVYEDIEKILKLTHKKIYSDYTQGDNQSNSLWIKN